MQNAALLREWRSAGRKTEIVCTSTAAHTPRKLPPSACRRWCTEILGVGFLDDPSDESKRTPHDRSVNCGSPGQARRYRNTAPCSSISRAMAASGLPYAASAAFVARVLPNDAFRSPRDRY